MRSFTTWPAPLPGGGTCEETALTFDQAREHRLLVIPALIMLIENGFTYDFNVHVEQRDKSYKNCVFQRWLPY